jgi:hypothetical protein
MLAAGVHDAPKIDIDWVEVRQLWGPVHMDLETVTDPVYRLNIIWFSLCYGFL